jgi:hypothetical protein
MVNNDNFSNQKSNTEAWRKLLVFQKASTLLKLIEHLVDGIPLKECRSNSAYEYAMLEHHTKNMMENALLIPVKIAGAEGTDIYDHKMENATVIRKAARDIITDTNGLHIAGFREVEYLDVVRREIEEFRPIFAEWIKTFNTSQYIIDRWGLFNPPGVDYNDLEEPEDLY